MIKIATYEYPVIYVYRIDDAKHKDLLKVGMTAIEAESADLLEPNCDELRQKATARINQQTGTAAIDYDLLYAELAFFEEGGLKYHFADFDVREVLANSGYANAGLTNNNGAVANEWVKVSDVEIVKKAITAVKERRSSLDPGDFKKTEVAMGDVIKFRDEQSRAIDETLARFKVGRKMLWNAKMRFGKTLCALEVIKRMQYRRTIIITHRPAVRSGWFEDFNLLDFGDDYYFGNKKVKMPNVAATEEQKNLKSLFETKVKEFDVLESGAEHGKMNYIYFASIQDLRGSWDKESGLYKKNQEIFLNDWDLLIVDEAHEGTKTELGQSVIAELQKHERMRTLYLSGTPYNILDNFCPEEIYSWTYEMEQQAKQRWYDEHPDEPNPYEDLPRLQLHTYNMDNAFDYDRDDESDFFNFAEFFRVEKEKRMDADGNMQLVSTDTFVHEKDVKAFLDLLCKDSADSNYPYSTEQYRYSLSHTLWVLPGVDEAAALSRLIKTHPTLSQYYIINVAGDGDDDQDNSDAVNNVKSNIATHERTITLTCGRLTTGVSVPEWSAVFMLCGGPKISAAFYLQTIFRAQTPTRRGVFPKKAVCYAFDFAPDRAIEVVSEYVDQQRRTSRRQPPEPRETTVETTLHFLAVIAHDGSQEKPYDTISFMKDVGDAYKDHIKRKGFRDRRLFVDLGTLSDEQYRAIGEIGLKMVKSGHTFGAGKGGNDGVITLAQTGLDPKPVPGPKTDETKKRTKKPKPQPPTPPRHKKPADKSKEAFKVLGDIYTRLPMLIFGCDLEGKDITLQFILDEVDDASWGVFMPKGVGKEEMETLMGLKILNEDRFASAASDIPKEIKAADALPITERVKAIAEMIARFRFPDKETVLTPWRVVNMHLSDTIGGYDFFDESHQHPLAEPRFVYHEGVTDGVFKADARILEINSKSGLYPLYMAYSLYRKRLSLPQTDRFAPSLDTDEGKLYVWDQVLRDNLYVLCMSEMAAKITHRVLAGYRDVKTNTRAYLKGADLVTDIKNELPNVVARIKGKNNFWGNNELDMNFDAIVGNPPYQVMDGGAQASASPIYQEFVKLSIFISPQYTSVIMPSRWYAGGKGLDIFREYMLNCKNIKCLHDFLNPDSVFPNTNIRGGLCYFLWSKEYDNTDKKVFVVTHDKEGNVSKAMRPLKTLDTDVFIRRSEALSIMEKVLSISKDTFEQHISNLRPFGLRGYFANDPNCKLSEQNMVAPIGIYVKGKKLCYVEKDLVPTHKEWIQDWKVFAPRANNIGTELTDDNFNAFVGRPGTICTESYMVLSVGLKLSESEAANICIYFKTRFARFMHSLSKASQDATSKTYRFVPLQDFSKNTPIDWTKSVAEIDEQLFDYYGLTEQERVFIMSTIKEMQ